MEGMFGHWEKLGKALNLEEQWLHEIFDEFPMDPAKRLRVILRKWRDTTDYPSLSTLHVAIKQLGLNALVPRTRSIEDSEYIHAQFLLVVIV